MKKKIVIIITILGLLTVSTLLTLGLLDKFHCENKILLSDWLMVACSILSLIGTTALAVITVWQTEKANRQNEALIEQNTELQKMNDRQFKIANQQFYPLLEPSDLSCKSFSVSEDINLANWQSGVVNSVDLSAPITFFHIDARKGQDNLAPKFETQVTCKITNISQAIINELEIYKFTCSSPFNNIVNTSWELFISTLTTNKYRILKMSFYHNNETVISRRDAVNFDLFFRIKTISNVIFYEKMHVFASNDYSFGEIEKVSDYEIKN